MHELFPRLPQAVSACGMVLTAVACGWSAWTIWTAGLTRMLGRPVPPPALLLRGPYRFVRYPCCSGLIAFLLGLLLWKPSWTTAAAVGVAVVGCRGWIAFQDARRLARFGEAYRRYRIAVPTLVPLRLRRRQQDSAG